MEPVLLGFIACIPPSKKEFEVARLMGERQTEEFCRRGIEYVRGYLAARDAQKAVWLTRFLAKFGFEDPMTSAARRALVQIEGVCKD